MEKFKAVTRHKDMRKPSKLIEFTYEEFADKIERVCIDENSIDTEYLNTGLLILRKDGTELSVENSSFCIDDEELIIENFSICKSSCGTKKNKNGRNTTIYKPILEIKPNIDIFHMTIDDIRKLAYYLYKDKRIYNSYDDIMNEQMLNYAEYHREK